MLVAQCELSRHKIGLLLKVVGRKFSHSPGNPATVGVVRWPAAGDTAGSSLCRLSSLQHRIYNLLGSHTLEVHHDIVHKVRKRNVKGNRQRHTYNCVAQRVGETLGLQLIRLERSALYHSKAARCVGLSGTADTCIKK